MKRLIALIALMVIATFGYGARAADIPLKAPPMAWEYNWSGFYGGVGLGWAHGKDHWAYTNPAPVTCCAPFTASSNDAVFGGIVGAQYQFSHLVFGVEGGINSFVGNENFASMPGCIAGSTQVCGAHLDSFYTFGGRLGWAAGKWLIYGDGGTAWANGHSQLLTPPSTLFDTANGKYNHGWYAGGGVDYVMYQGGLFDFITGLEYQHLDFGTAYQASSADAFGPSPPGVNGRNIGMTEDMVRARATIKWKPF